jgi:hypothetical protein
VSSKNTIIADSLNLKLSGAGIMDLDLKVKNLRTEISGSGTILLTGAANDHNAEISGSGVVEANVLEEIDAKISGSGTVYYRGSPEKIGQDISDQEFC